MKIVIDGRPEEIAALLAKEMAAFPNAITAAAYRAKKEKPEGVDIRYDYTTNMYIVTTATKWIAFSLEEFQELVQKVMCNYGSSCPD